MTATEQFLHVLLYEVSPYQFPVAVIAREFLHSHNWEHLAIPLGHFARSLQSAPASWCFHGLDVLLNKLVVG